MQQHHPLAGISPHGASLLDGLGLPRAKWDRWRLLPWDLPLQFMVFYILPWATAPINKAGLPGADVKPVAACMLHARPWLPSSANVNRSESAMRY